MIIGVTPRKTLNDVQILAYHVNVKYIEKLQSLGFKAVMLLANQDNTELLELCDGFLVTGGVDINPALYNRENQASTGIDDELDAVDYQVLEYASKTKKPVLGICRGHQIINAYFGGTLNQDIENHKDSRHGVELTKDIFELKDIQEVNTYHHQVVETLAESLEELYLSTDGYNEGAIHKTLPIISVQWHPEREEDNIIFDYFKTMFK